MDPSAQVMQPIPATVPGSNDPAPAQQGSVQDRINQITHARREAERRAEDLSLENQTLSDQLRNLTSQVASLSRRPEPAPAPTPSLSDMLRPNQESTPAASTSRDTVSVVQDAVNQALRPFVEAATVERQRQDMVSRQLQHFNAVAQSMPALNDERSSERKLFEQIWGARRDLHAIEDAPRLVAEIVRGLVSDARRNDAGVAARKTAAGVPNGQGRQLSLFTDHSEVDVAKENISAIKERMIENGSGWNRHDIADMIAHEIHRQYHGGAPSER